MLDYTHDCPPTPDCSPAGSSKSPIPGLASGPLSTKCIKPSCYYKCPPRLALARRTARLSQAERVYSAARIREMLSDETARKKLRGCIFLSAKHGGMIEDIDSLGNINTLEGNSPSVYLTARKPARRSFEGVGRGAMRLSDLESVVCPFDYAANQVWTAGPSLATELSCLQKLDHFVAPVCKTCQVKNGNLVH